MRAKKVCHEIESRGGVVIRQTRSRWRLVVRLGRGHVALVHVPKRWVPPETVRIIERQLEPAFGERWLTR
jgi:predicted RNA binding protein YcfA (HicA-like mRNA interferase family)